MNSCLSRNPPSAPWSWNAGERSFFIPATSPSVRRSKNRVTSFVPCAVFEPLPAGAAATVTGTETATNTNTASKPIRRVEDIREEVLADCLRLTTAAAFALVHRLHTRDGDVVPVRYKVRGKCLHARHPL